MQNKRHGGYTLIEILVAFAVLGIAILGIGGFFVSASRSYSSVNDETSLQYEAQLALNQLENMLIDSALGVSYNYVTTADESPSGYHFVESDNSALGEAVSKVLYVFNINEIDKSKLDILLMKWVPANKSIYYRVIQEGNSSLEVKDIDISGTDGEWDLLAEDVVAFSVDLSGYKQIKKVHINLGIENRSKEYYTTGTVLLRNDILINEPNISKIYEHISLLIKSEIKGVELRANTNVTIPGGIVQFYAKVLGTGYPNQRIHQWVVASDATFSNIIYDSDTDYTAVAMPETYVDTNSHTLYVSNQTAGMPETLYVKAIVKTVDDAGSDVTYEASVPIGIKVINDIEVSVTADTTQTYNSNLAGAVFQQAVLSAQRVNPANVPVMDLSHQNIVQMHAAVSASGTITAEERAVSWSIHSLDTGVMALIDTSGQLKISQYSRTGTCVVRATLKLDRSVYVDYAVRVVTEYGSSDSLVIIPDKSSINRGGSMGCSLTLNGTPVDNADYNWSVSVVNSQGQEINGTPVVANTRGEVYVNYDLSYDYSYDVWVKATLKTNSEVFGSTKVTVPKVTMSLSPATNYAVMGATVTGFTCVATGLEDYNIKWSMAKDLNPHYYFTAWGNFNITGSKLANGSSTAAVVMGSKNDPMTNCTVKAYLENNTNYSATARIITSDVKMNISGLNSKTGKTGVTAVSRGSSLQLKVSLSKADPNISVSNSSVEWEIVNIKVDGAVKPELMDGNISLSDTGKLELSSEFAKAYATATQTSQKNVVITVRAKDTKHGLDSTIELNVPYMTISGKKSSNGASGVTVVNRGSSLQMMMVLSKTDPNISVAGNTAKWEIVNVKVDGKVKADLLKDNMISIDNTGKLTLDKEFASAYSTSKKNVVITVKATNQNHGMVDTVELTVPYMKISGETSVSRGSSAQLSITMSKTDPNVSITQNTVAWEITSVSVDNEVMNDLIDDSISISKGYLTLSKAFAKEHYDNANVKITITATDAAHNHVATHTVTVPAVAITPAEGAFIIHDGSSAKTIEFNCSVAESWQICDPDGNVLGSEAPISIDSNGVLTVPANDASSDDHSYYLIRAVLPEGAGYKEYKVCYGFMDQNELQGSYSAKTPVGNEQTVDDVKIENNFRVVESMYKDLTQEGYKPVCYVLHEVYKYTYEEVIPEDSTDPEVVEVKQLVSTKHYAFISYNSTLGSGAGAWFVFNEGTGKWSQSPVPKGWENIYFNN